MDVDRLVKAVLLCIWARCVKWCLYLGITLCGFQYFTFDPKKFRALSLEERSGWRASLHWDPHTGLWQKTMLLFRCSSPEMESSFISSGYRMKVLLKWHSCWWVGGECPIRPEFHNRVMSYCYADFRRLCLQKAQHETWEQYLINIVFIEFVFASRLLCSR